MWTKETTHKRERAALSLMEKLNMLLENDLGKDRGHGYWKNQKVADAIWDYSGLESEMFALWKFIEVYIYNLLTFLKIRYILKNWKFYLCK